MLLHLDSRDLINAFKGKPIDMKELRSALIERKAKLIYSPETIQEVVTPADVKESRRRLETLIILPHRYIRQQKEIIKREFSVAIREVKSAKKFSRDSIVPFVSTWQVVLHPGEIRIEDQIIDELVNINMKLLASNPDVFRNTKEQFDAYAPNFTFDRLHKLNFRTGNKGIFRDAIGGTLKIIGLHPSNALTGANLVDDLTNWMRERPAVCPSWRLLGETYSEFVVNTTDKGRLGDEPDLRHVSVMPYVDAITLDATMRGYVKAASRRLAKLAEPINYQTRIFDDLNHWLRPLVEATENS
jgi:hypothetical protein